MGFNSGFKGLKCCNACRRKFILSRKTTVP